MSHDEWALRLETLQPGHDLDTFDCGRDALNAYLSQQAWSDQQSRKARTYVACRGAGVIAYLSLAAGAVEAASSSEAIARRRRRQLVPVVLLTRIGVEESEERAALLEAMLLEALRRAAAAADVFGARAVIVNGEDQEARSFYERCGFEPLPASPLHLVLAVKDIRRSLGM